MNKFFSFILSLFFALSIGAQTTDTSVQFSDKYGDIIADGLTLTLNQYEEDFFGNIQVSSGLFLKNTTDGSVRVTVDYTIITLSSGTFQMCFPQNCVVQSRIGTYVSDQCDLSAGELRDMRTEWLPTAKGTCKVSMKIVTYKQNPITKEWVKKGDGPSINLNFVYDPTGNVDIETEVSVHFTDNEGNIIPDNTTLTLNKQETNIFGNTYIPSGLFVKNTANSSVRVAISYTISSLSSGTFQICFPQSCVVQNRVGTFISEQGDMVANESRDMQAEWFPTSEGICNVTLKLFVYKKNSITNVWEKNSEGPSITLHFVYTPEVEIDKIIPVLISCNSKGSVNINDYIDITNKIDNINVFENTESTFVFTPKVNCRLEQIILNGFDITASVEDNTLKAVIPANSQMVVTFARESGDMNNDGSIDISDVVSLVNLILGN